MDRQSRDDFERETQRIVERQRQQAAERQRQLETRQRRRETTRRLDQLLNERLEEGRLARQLRNQPDQREELQQRIGRLQLRRQQQMPILEGELALWRGELGMVVPAKGLTAVRIGKFEHFVADESLVGDQCLVCMSDLEIGTQMVRPDCHVSHYLCKICADTWFKDHKSCPTCREVFK